ncbi:hypothetical protein CFP65_3735 [Kitasatospora sp. MMS16-BH015]|uniref:hypothetical protein n=1 Tax=Kitasatospora sp. MMS16-BH015 TaxID=2018025 RepID=UPI000CA2641D|nr:hypothetical protein [Kitasatospora sp. MMS16-BH015]AUG78521.1 hypothetical protein CFP65_3735 [Kitasatospora sp. MMS16-BH015]
MSAQKPLLDQRATLVLLLGVLTGVAAGVLTALGGAGAADAVLAGGAGFAGGVVLFQQIVG